MPRYEVLAWTINPDDPDGGWIEARVWFGDNLITALRQWRIAQRDHLGLYVSLRWNG